MNLQFNSMSCHSLLGGSGYNTKTQPSTEIKISISTKTTSAVSGIINLNISNLVVANQIFCHTFKVAWDNHLVIFDQSSRPIPSHPPSALGMHKIDKCTEDEMNCINFFVTSITNTTNWHHFSACLPKCGKVKANGSIATCAFED